MTGEGEGMIVNVVPGADLPYVLIEGICSDRALGVLLRAVTPWYAFGRYDHVVVDLTGFDDWSPRIVEQLATAVTEAGVAGHWLAFFPVDEPWMREAELGQLNGYPDRAHAELALYENRLMRRRRSERRELVRKFRHALSRTLSRGELAIGNFLL
jgi:hypothetical protein